MLAKHYKDYLQKKYNTEGHVLTLPGHRDAKVVTVAGLTSNPNYYLMHRTDEGWEIFFKQPPPSQFYFFLVDGKKVFDPANPVKMVVPTPLGPEEVNILKAQ